MKKRNIPSHYEVNISNDKAELYEKIVFVKLLAIFVIVFQRYPSTYYLMQGYSCDQYVISSKILL